MQLVCIFLCTEFKSGFADETKITILMSTFRFKKIIIINIMFFKNFKRMLAVWIVTVWIVYFLVSIALNFVSSCLILTNKTKFPHYPCLFFKDKSLHKVIYNSYEQV